LIAKGTRAQQQSPVTTGISGSIDIAHLKVMLKFGRLARVALKPLPAIDKLLPKRNFFATGYNRRPQNTTYGALVTRGQLRLLSQ
jgi:hypothetical protein